LRAGFAALQKKAPKRLKKLSRAQNCTPLAAAGLANHSERAVGVTELEFSCASLNGDRGLTMAGTRKIAAILVADIVGYSRLTGADEVRTLSRLRGLWGDLINPAVEAHDGRVIKRTGDGGLIEFRSVVDAVRCAIELQNGAAERSAGLPAERRIEFRIGVHLGDVVEEADGDLMGDGVNVAARLEGICEPGDIYLSEQAYWLVKGRLDIAARDLGPTRLKNIADSVRVFSLQVSAPIRVNPAAGAKPSKPSRRLTAVVGQSVAVALALALAIGALEWRLGSTSREPAPSVAAVEDRVATAPRFSIAVLPFENLNGDSSQQNLADSLTADLTAGLSQRKGSFVIAGAAAFADKGKPIDAREIGRGLGVRYALEGAVRRVGETVTVSVRLVSTETGEQVWTDRFETERGQLGRLRAELVARLADSLGMDPIKSGSPPASREWAIPPLTSDTDEPASRRAVAPQQQTASPPLAEKASEAPTYCGTPMACRRNGGTYRPLVPE
jgi:adenylate cyclase